MLARSELTAIAATAPYSSCYCEENAWQLANRLPDKELATIVFVSNPMQTVAYFQQRAAPPGQATIWDYHVWIMIRIGDRHYVLDRDSRLCLGLTLRSYLTASFPNISNWSPELVPLFRVVPAATYLQHFCSDRRHMRRGSGWHKPPPPWPAIGQGHTLPSYTSVSGHGPGRVLTLDCLRQQD